MKRILIFIRTFNDFDQALPIIEYISSEKNSNVSVWSFEKELKGCDNHLNYLENFLGIKVEYLFDHLSGLSKINHKCYSYLLKLSSYSIKNPALIPLTIIVSRTRFVFNYFFRIGYSKLFGKYSFDNILIDTGMDSTIHGQNILLSAKKQQITTIGYAHGYSVYSNKNSVQKGKVSNGAIKRLILGLAKPKIKRSIYAKKYLTGCGQISAQFKKTHASGYFDSQELRRVLEIGMPRYTFEWCQKYKNEILKNQKFQYGDDKKLNVVLFMSHPQYNVHVEKLYSLIENLFSMTNINFVYKPHTRKGLHLINTKQLKGFDASDVSSVLLSEWADVGVVYGSSIGFQMLIDNVPLVIPTFVHSNKTIFESSGISIVANSINIFNDILNKPKEEIVSMVDKRQVDKFINSIIYGSNRENMMKDYCSFFS